MTRKPSLFERLTGSVRLDSSFNEEPESLPVTRNDEVEEYDDATGELALDVIDIGDAYVVRAITAGVPKDSLDITLSRESIGIEGIREDSSHSVHDGILTQELYWGSFSRTFTFPEEVDLEEAKAHESHGLLTITLPKIDRYRQTKVKVQ
jgi:HSP20 family protein